MAHVTTGFVLAIGGLILLAAPDPTTPFVFGEHTITTVHLALGLLALGLMILTRTNEPF